MKDLYVVSCCRTAIGTFGGSLKDVTAADMGATVIKAALERGNVKPEQVDEVMFGCVLTTAQGQNVARQAALNAGLPVTVPAYTVGMVCGSGMKSLIEAGRSILAGDAEIIVAGGTENMSLAPYAVPSARYGARMGNANMIDTMVNDGLTDAFGHYHMGVTAENICDQWNLSREALDQFALASQNKAEAAQKSGRFVAEIVPVMVKEKRQMVEFKVDEFPRHGTTIDALTKLRPAFKKENGRVTAGNASGINDGAAAIILASGEAVKKYGLKPMAKLVSWGQGGVDPNIMGIGPVPASRQALEKCNLSMADIDLVEANEAFAAQSLAVAHDLELDMEKVNVNGGAIAIGHPVGASGARIIVTLLHEMEKRKAHHGLATLCIGGGMGVATIFELCE